MNRRTDTCPRACTVRGVPVVRAPETWTATTDGAQGTYRCPVCHRTWTVAFRAEMEDVEWA